MPRWLRLLLYALAVLASVGVVVVGAWAVDASSHEGRVLRNVTVAGHDVSGSTGAELARVIADLADDVPGQEVEIRAPGGGFRVPAEALGVAVDQPATLQAALDVGRSGNIAERFSDWIRSIGGERRAPLVVSVDEPRVFATVDAMDPGPRTPPTEPSIPFSDGAIRAVDGKPGKGIDAKDVIGSLPDAARAGRTIVVDVPRGDVEPRFPKAQADRLADAMQAKVSSTVQVTAAGVKASVPVATLRSWVTSEVRGDELAPTLNAEATRADLAKLLADAGEPAVQTSFRVEGGAVQVTPGKSGTRCCAPEAVAVVQAALFDDSSAPPAELPLREQPPDLSPEDAEKLGVTSPIGSFTTRHPGGQPRVANIHRIADLLRGTLIRPGKTFSVNSTVGKRTADKGFVSAPVIEEGKFTEDVGGGVSQFATTLFNAAFEAGLDFGEYQSHSIYISRYPYGREATLSYPHPDLEIENTSSYGVLVWPTYTDTTITVTLYSTKFADVRQSGQSEAPRGACKRVTTERTRTYLADGRSEVDKVFATYRPGEGVNC